MDLVQRFLKYVSFDTQSAEESETFPSTLKQLEIARYLKSELEELGLQEVTLDENGYVFATLPANTEKELPTVGFIAHYDTSPDCSGKDIHPRIVSNYDGGDIVLSEGIVTTTKQYPELLNHVGEDIIVTDGTTLLGADDKAGIAEIVQAMAWLLEHPEVKHGRIRVGFNPDEEIGMGASRFDVEAFGADFAYTMDGSEVGELEYECFNAASAKVLIKGLNVHPGYAKGKMRNANRIAAEFIDLVPTSELPETTDGYEGFYHLMSTRATVEEATLSYIIRDHDRQIFEQRKAQFQKWADILNERWGAGSVEVQVHDQYANMLEMIRPVMYVVDIAKQAIEETGIPCDVKPIRGGTDGAQLSYKGLPCPNIFAGGLNFHGRHEFAPVQSLERAMQVVINICRIVAEQ